jgi:hypothetical protein
LSQIEKNQAKPEKTEPKLEKTESKSRKPSQAGLNRFFSLKNQIKIDQFEPVSVFFQKKFSLVIFLIKTEPN